MKLLFTFAALLAAGAATAATGQTMSELRWAKRVLIVFAPSDDARLSEQRERLLLHEADLADRDMLVFVVLGHDEIRPLYGEVPAGEQAADLRERYGGGNDTEFTTALIGKDGGVKWRSDGPADTGKLFAIIDAMPMRRSGG